MANKIATLKTTLTYTGPSDEAVSVPKSLSIPYQSQNAGAIDVADGTASATSYAIPFGSVAKPTLIIVENNSGQELQAVIDTQALHGIPDGGTMTLIASTTEPTDQVSTLSMKTTALQDGAGTIAYRVFGDPLADP